MTVDPDEQLGAELDSYLESLEDGQLPADAESQEAGSESTSELATLRSLVGELHQMARLFNAEGEGRPPRALPDRLGKYRLQRPLGSGGQSTTCLAHDEELDRLVVLKLYHDGSSEQRERLLQEARAFALVDSPYVAKCYDVDQSGETPFVVLEYLPGEPLDRLAARQQLTERRVVEIVLDVARGLAEVHHRGLVHRDIKPANIVVLGDQRAVIVDFGMAHLQFKPATTVAGTPAYLAPEQARREVDRIGAATDVFGVGAVLYELLTGSPPFMATTRQESLRLAAEGTLADVRERNPHVSRQLAEVCRRCLVVDPSDRFPSMEALIEDLETVRPADRRPLWAAAAAILAATLIGVGIFWGRGVQHPPLEPARRGPITSSTQPPLERLPSEAVEFFAMDGQLRQDFWIEVDILGAGRDALEVLQLVAGDQIAFRVQAERDCYVTILAFDSESVTQLFPRAPFDDLADSRVPANRAWTVPRSDGPSHAAVIATPSRGAEALCVLASTVPISLSQNDQDGPQLVYDSAHSRRDLQERLRGLVRRPESASYSVSQLVVPYWVSPREVD